MKEIKEIILKSVHMENFKRFKEKTIEFGENITSIFGENFKGKSSVSDAFSWVLFNKSSTGNVEGKHFRPRRYDENGVNIDFVDVVVEIILLVDGVETKIRKVQMQKWVRHRGSESEVYEGDSQVYEWNDVPTTATDHKKKVAEIISEEVFMLLTNPAAFPSKSEKDQRKFLMDHVEKITNEDVIASHPEFSSLVATMGNLTLEELEAKNKKELDAYEGKKKEIPIRIDQESKRIEDIDFSGKEAELKILQEKLQKVEDEISDAGKAYEEVNVLKVEKAKLEGSMAEIKGKIGIEIENKKYDLMRAVESAKLKFNEAMEKQSKLESSMQVYTADIGNKEKELSELREKYKEEMAKELGDDAYICPTCGQEIPEDQKEKVKADFASKKKNVLDAINLRGKKLSSEISENKERIASYEKEIEELKQKKIESMGEEKKAKEKLDSFLENPDNLEENAEYKALMEQVAELENKISHIDNSTADENMVILKKERDVIQSEIDEVKESLAKKKVIDDAKKTVKELEDDMVQNTQNLANCEKLKNEIEKFRATKNQMLSDRVNKRFKVVKWKLFETQKNGGIKDVCVCMIHGSAYGENTTSATERMMAGMDIISTLQEIYEVKAPIFLDDADLYNDWNIPDMGSQMIKLCVSKDDDLRVEV